MPPKCSICSHKARHEIDMALVEGSASLRDIAVQYDTSKDALKRHKDNGHITPKLVKAAESKEIIVTNLKTTEAEEIKDRAIKILDIAEKTGDVRSMCAAIREVRGCIELLAKMSGVMKGNETNVNVSVITHEYRLVKGVDPPVRK